MWANVCVKRVCEWESVSVEECVGERVSLCVCDRGREKEGEVGCDCVCVCVWAYFFFSFCEEKESQAKKMSPIKIVRKRYEKSWVRSSCKKNPK